MSCAGPLHAWTLVLALLAPQEPGVEDPMAAELTRILVRAEEPDDAALASTARELVALGEVAPLLIDVVGRGRTPEPDGQRLGPRQLELACEALLLTGGRRLGAFVHEVEADPRSPERVAAALRIVARQSNRDAIASLTGLARAAESRTLFADVEPVFEAALAELLARDPSRVRRLAAPFTELSPAGAAVAVRVVGATGSADALQCLRTQLGRRAELDGPVLAELARVAHRSSPEEAHQLAGEALPYLRSRTPGESQAAAVLLGRLAVPDSVPGLIECLVDESPSTVRAGLAALRAVGGVGLPASPALWRSWYGREETWWQERAPELFLVPAAGLDDEQFLGEISARLREVSEHRLHRNELVARLAPLLSSPRPAVRTLVCECLARLGSRLALPALAALCADPDGEVAAAARTAMDALEDGKGAHDARHSAS